jgi:hypothetical protein
MYPSTELAEFGNTTDGLELDAVPAGGSDLAFGGVDDAGGDVLVDWGG